MDVLKVRDREAHSATWTTSNLDLKVGIKLDHSQAPAQVTAIALEK